tara:strand:- start:1022 stop:1534 length:513 start_codon:yes stop_codon:yes gene_type:complete
MDDIIVIDDFLNEEELSMVGSLSTYTDEKWNIHGSTLKGGEVFPDFQTSFLKKDLMDTEYYTSYIFNKIKKRFNQDYKLKDVYLNAHEPLRNGSFHIDDNADRTVILYITPWEPAWGGFTHFIRSDKDHSVIAPVLGRLVNFQSKLVHKAYAYCNSICPIRITAAFKLKL